MLHKHRILPGHMGGTYTPDNVELLTVAEHAEAHRLLFENFGHEEDRIAWRALSGQINVSKASLEAQQIGRIKSAETRRSPEMRSRASVAARVAMLDPRVRARHRAAVQEAMNRPEVRANLIASHKGKPGHPSNPATNAKISAACKGRKRSPETCAKLSAAAIGRIVSPETRAKKRQALKGVPWSASRRLAYEVTKAAHGVL